MTNRTNVLFMQSQTYFGADSYLHSLLMRDLDKDQFEVHVAINAGLAGENSPAARELEKIPGIHLRPTNFGVSLALRHPLRVIADTARYAIPSLVDLLRLALYARKHGIDIVHCTEKPRDAFYGQLIAKLSNARCIVELHVKAEDWIAPTTQWAMRQADGVVGVSRFVADSIVAHGIPPERTHAVLNAIEVDRWNPRRDGSHIRRELAIPAESPVLLAISRLCVWKGHIDLLRALERVKRLSLDFRLLIVGEDDRMAHPGGGSFTAELEDLVDELDLAGQVTFTGYRRDVEDLMAACDIYTMPSFEEPFGMVFLEAMCMKRPIVALNNGGVPEFVHHGDAGLLSEPGDIDQLAANIARLIREPHTRREMGERGRAIAEQEFGSVRMTRDMEDVYRSVLGGAGTSAG